MKQETVSLLDPPATHLTTRIPPVLSSLPFDPSFQHRLPDDDVILQSEDGVHFHFNLATLSEYSPFFSSMASLPQPLATESTPNESIIPLPAATSHALRFVLSILGLLKGRSAMFPPPPEPRDKPLFALNADVLEVIERYEIPVIGTITVYEVCVLFDQQPLHLFALAAAADYIELAKHASQMTVDLHMSDIPSEAERCLQACAPKYLDRLRNLHHHRARWRLIFKQALIVNEPMGDIFMLFDKACRPWPHCPAYTSVRGDFPELRRRAASAMYEAFHLKRAFWKYDNLVPNIRYIVGCQRCTARLSETFVRAAEHNRGVFWLTDTI